MARAYLLPQQKTQSMKVWESNQVVEHLLDIHKAMGSIPTSRKKISP